MKVLVIMALCLFFTHVFAVSEGDYSSAEDYLAAKISKKEINPKNLSQTFEFKNKKYKVSDFDAVIQDKLSAILDPMGVEDAEQFAQNYLTAKAHIIRSDTQSTQRKIVLKNLENMFGMIYGGPGKKQLEKKIQECREPVQKFETIEEIVTKVENSREIEGCKSLGRGEHKVFKKKEAYSTGNYLLRRKSDGNYQAVLNLEFEKVDGNISESAMMAKAKNCMALASKAMKGPGGAKLEISIMKPEEVYNLPDDQRPAVTKIKIQNSEYFTDSANYSDKVDCPVITHEVLHLFGLCDEYKETRPQFLKHNWTCRVVTKSPSVMRDTRFFDEAIPQKVTCDCNETCQAVLKTASDDLKKLYTTYNAYDVIPFKYRAEYCKNEDATYVDADKLDNPSKGIILKRDSGSTFVFENREVASLNVAPFYSIQKTKVTCSCPAGDDDCMFTKDTILKKVKTLSVKSTCPPHSKKISSAPAEKSNVVAYSNGVLTLHPRPTIPSLLQPSHFNKILTGNCPGPADQYNQCSSYAYKGEPCNVPSSCRQDDYFLGTPQ